MRVELEWRKSSYSANQGDCVEVSTSLPGIVIVRDSKGPSGPVLRFTADEWTAFTTGVNAVEHGSGSLA